MRMPIVTPQVDLDVTGARRPVVELQHRAAKVRAALPIPEARMQDLHAPPVFRAQPIAVQTLVKPDRLQQPLRRWIRPVVQVQDRAAEATPFGVRTGREQTHLAPFLVVPEDEVKPAPTASHEEGVFGHCPHLFLLFLLRLLLLSPVKETPLYLRPRKTCRLPAPH